MAMKITPVAPARTRTANSLCGRVVSMREYPPSPQGEAFRTARVGAGLSLREMASQMRITPTDLAAVERGAAMPEDWPLFWRASGLEKGEKP